MSMMLCGICDRLIDTDDDVEGIWPRFYSNNDQVPEFICGACCDDMLDDEYEELGYDPESREPLPQAAE